MNEPNDKHVDALAEAYVAGALDDAERRAVEAHAAGCPACAAALDAARAADADLHRLFAAARPDATFEDRLVADLRPDLRTGSRMRLVGGGTRRLHPAVRRIATAAAAAIVLGAAGYGVTAGIEAQDRWQTAAAHRPARPAGADVYRRGGERQSGAARGPVNQRERDASGLADRYDDTLRHPADWPDVPAAGERAFVGGNGGEPSVETGIARNSDSSSFAMGRRPSDGPAEAGTESNVGQGVRYADGHVEAAVTPLSLAKERKEDDKSGPVREGREVKGKDNAPADPAKAAPAAATDEFAAVRADGTRVLADGKLDVVAGFVSPNDYYAWHFTAPPTGVIQNQTTATPEITGLAAARGTVSVPDGGTLQLGGQTVPGQTEGTNGVIVAGVTPTNVDFAKAPNFNLSGGTLAVPGSKPGEGNTALFFDGVKLADGTASSGPVAVLTPPKLEAERAFRPGEAAGEKLNKGVAVAGGPARGTGAAAGDEVWEQESSGSGKLAGTVVGKGGRPGDASGKKELADQPDAPKNAPATKEPPTILGLPVATPPATPPPGTSPPATPSPAVTPPPPVRTPMARRIIRNGEVVFEVDSFDTALSTIGKIAGEEDGVVSATSSDKQPNGKVAGSVTVRCPPDRLDTLVLKLRGIGDLKSQRIAATDVTKMYTDLEAQLRAGKAMEQRLLEIIKTGGAVKDLLEAEKQLGVWRERIERVEGEIRYYNDQISMSTLVVTLNERDVRSPTAAFEAETVNAGIEADDVEKARAEALAAIEKAKGRVVDSTMNKEEGDQFVARIEADVPPDAAGPVVDRLRQLGRVARLDVSRKTTTQGGAGPIVAGLKVERRDTRLSLSIYNLARATPRQVTTLVVAAPDVEATYKAFLAQAAVAGGRVVSSQLNRPQADQAVGQIELQVPTAAADAVLAALRTGVDAMSMTSTVSVDKESTTDAKRGFVVTVKSLAHVPPRETTSLTLFSADVPGAFAKLTEAARAAGGRVTESQLNEQDPANRSARLAFDVPREKWSAVDAALRDAGLAVSRNTVRSQDTEQTVDSKVRLSLSLQDEIRLTPREAIQAVVATSDVPAAFGNLVDAAKAAGARVVGSNLNLNDRTNPTGRIGFTTAREGAEKFEAAVRAAGLVVRRTVNRQADGPTTVDTRVGFDVEVIPEAMLVARELVKATVATKDVPATHAALAAAARAAGAAAVTSNLRLDNPASPSGELSFAVPREKAEAFEAAMAKAGIVVGRTVARPPELPNMVESKVGYTLTVAAERSLTPRETRTMLVVVPSARERFARALDALRLTEAYVVVSQLGKGGGPARGELQFVVDRRSLPTIEKALTDGGGDIVEPQVERSADTTKTVDHLVRVGVTLVDAERQEPRRTYKLGVETPDLNKAVGDLEALAVQVGGRTLESTRSTNDQGVDDSAEVVLNVPLARAAEVVAAARGQGRVTAASVERSERVPEGSLSRALVRLSLTSPASVRPERGLADTVREGVNTGLTALLRGLKYVIVGVLIAVPLLVLWWVLRAALRRRRRTVEVNGPTPTPTPA